MRTLILEANPEMTEECKWIKPTNPLGVPVWSHAGIVCTGETYTKVNRRARKPRRGNEALSYDRSIMKACCGWRSAGSPC